MTFNPFEQKTKPIETTLESWKDIFVPHYDKNETDPYTKLRIILMNGTEFEANWFSHQFSRHCADNDVRRQIALIRRVEQQQQKKLSSLKPTDENILETTIGYEQLAVELTANLARREKDGYVREQLNFALLEDFDHLYRFSNLLKMEYGIEGADLVARRTEITPGRPTISEHRFPYDDVRHHIDNKTASPITRLNASIITAAEQQTMNFYMNVGSTYPSEIGRKMYGEIAMIEEQHVTEYGCLNDVNCTWFEGLLEHEYTECYLYWSCMQDEKNEKVKCIWETCLQQELAHLKFASELLEKHESKHYTDVFPQPEFPEPITFGQDNIEYVQSILKKTAYYTAVCENYVDVRDLDPDYKFFKLQKKLNGDGSANPTHNIIEMYIDKYGNDYRFETKNNPVKELQCRTADNTTVGRITDHKH